MDIGLPLETQFILSLSSFGDQFVASNVDRKRLEFLTSEANGPNLISSNEAVTFLIQLEAFSKLNSLQ